MNCIKCGSYHKSFETYCWSCGAPVNGATGQEPVEVQPADASKSPSSELEGYWYAIIWGSVFLGLPGVLFLIVITIVMSSVYGQKNPAKARTIVVHSILAIITGIAIAVALFMAGLSIVFGAITLFGFLIGIQHPPRTASPQVPAQTTIPALSSPRQASRSMSGVPLRVEQHPMNAPVSTPSPNATARARNENTSRVQFLNIRLEGLSSGLGMPCVNMELKNGGTSPLQTFAVKVVFRDGKSGNVLGEDQADILSWGSPLSPGAVKSSRTLYLKNLDAANISTPTVEVFAREQQWKDWERIATVSRGKPASEAWWPPDTTAVK